MSIANQKMSKIVDGLFSYFFYNIGSTDIKLELKRKDDGFELSIYSTYPPSARKEVLDLERFLNPPDRNGGIEDLYWGLVGGSFNGGSGGDSELPLIGQMIDNATVKINEADVNLIIFKKDS